jgi:hypothetical protein
MAKFSTPPGKYTYRCQRGLPAELPENSVYSRTVRRYPDNVKLRLLAESVWLPGMGDYRTLLANLHGDSDGLIAFIGDFLPLNMNALG